MKHEDKGLLKQPTENQRILTDAEINAIWRNGYDTALACYTWWTDGTQYVGCGVKTLKEALANRHRIVSTESLLKEIANEQT